ncbi:MAG: GlyGly-CTERM sorting domain-containing protein [Sinimarinibacterium sp.]|jgi:hypothetical protein
MAISLLPRVSAAVSVAARTFVLLAAMAGSASAQAWSAGDPLPMGATQIWNDAGTYGYSAYAPPIPDDSNQDQGVSSEESHIHEFEFAVPTGYDDLALLEVNLNWALEGKDYLTLEVNTPDGKTATCYYVNTAYQTVSFPKPKAGRYTVKVRESRTTGGEFSVAATLTRAAADTLPPLALGTDRSIDDVVVIAVVDSNVNPYHWDYLASKMPQHLNSDANDDLPLDQDPSTWVPGYPQKSAFKSLTRLDLTLEPTDGTKTSTSLHAADQAQWNKIQYSEGTLNKDVHMYWFPGTKIIGHVVFDDSVSTGYPASAAVFEPQTGAFDTWAADSHGVGTSSVSTGNIHGSCPNCLLVYVHGTGEQASQWVSKQDWIDLQTNSWGLSATMAARDRIYAGSDTELQRRATERGQSMFFSAGNGLDNAFVVPNPTLFSSQEGPDWVVTVGAIEDDGTSPGHGRPADISSIGSSYPSAYGGGDTVNAEGGFGGTSNATPVIAGIYGESLYRIRRMLAGASRGQSGGIVARGAAGCGTANPQCALADGKITVHEMREALYRAAEYTAAGYNAGGLSAIPETDSIQELTYLSQAHGAFYGRMLGEDTYEREIRRVHDYLQGLWFETPSQDDKDWYVADSVCRQSAWGEWAYGYAQLGLTELPAPSPLWPVRSWLTDGCPATLPQLVELEKLYASQFVDLDSSANDTDDDGTANATDNCPNLANTDQADADADGTGDACDTSGPVTPDPLAVSMSATYSKPANGDGTYPTPVTVTFTATGSGGPNSNYRYTFNFGDGTYVGPQTQATATHTYEYANQDGYHTKVVITDADATQSAMSSEILIKTQSTVTVNGGTVIDLTLDKYSGTAPVTVTANANGPNVKHDVSAASTAYTFDFGDGSALISNTSGTASHVYTKPEAVTYTITVTMTDKNAGGGDLGTSSGTAMVAVNSGNQLTALLSVNPTLAQIGQDVTFNGCASFTADDETITKYVFDPDGIGSLAAVDRGTTCTFTYAYASAGQFTPTLTVTDSTGDTAKVSVESVMIQTPPSPGTGGGTGGGTDVGGVNNRSGGGALGWLTLLPLGLAAARRRRHALH